MNKLTLRGQTKVNAQWQLYCLVHNIESCKTRCIKKGKPFYPK
nr:transposase [Pseudoalteromonas arctica]